MSRKFHIGQTVVPYEVDWSEERETIGLSIDESMSLTVTAPMAASLTDIEEVLEDRTEWILEKMYALGEQANPSREKEFLSGEKLLYRGRQYPLSVAEADVPEPELSFDGDEFTLAVHRLDAPADDVSIRRKRQTVIDWYVQRAEEELPERAARFNSKLGADEVVVQVEELENKWGEYQNGTVRLHWRLVLAPVRIQDYVIAHELAHESHRRHSRAFWNSVGSVIPDYKERQEWLRINGSSLSP